MLKTLTKILALGVLCGAALATHANEAPKFKPTKSHVIAGKWRGEMKGQTNIIGKAYIGPSNTSVNVFHVWTGPSSNRTHCRYMLTRVGKLKDKSVLFKEKNNGVKSCRPHAIRVKRVGLKFIEIVRMDINTNREIWRGNLKLMKNRRPPRQNHDSEIEKWIKSPIDQTINKIW
ncbi:MAG: hypothetical protein RSG77_21575 [Hafnia sp.]